MMVGSFEDCDIGVRAGASLVRHPFCFDITSSCVLCCCGSSVVVYSVKTGEQIQRLVERSEVVSVELNPKNTLQAVVCTVDGVVSYWDFEDGLRLKECQLSRKGVTFFRIRRDENSHNLSWCYSGLDSDAQLGFYLVTVKPAKIGEQQLSTSEFQLLRSVPEDSRKLDVNRKGNFVAFVGEGEYDGSVNQGLFIKSCKKENNKIFKHFVNGPAVFTCVAFHSDPSLNCLATGDNQGKIIIWYDFLNSQPQKSICHWHTTPVNVLAFSDEGSILYSGGDESVMVKWQIRDGGKGKQSFLPRLGAPIQRISVAPDSGQLAVGCSDNGIRVLSNQSQVEQLLQGLVLGAWKPPSQFKSVMPAGLICDHYGSMGPLTKGCIITNGRPGEIQFYSAIEDRQLFSVDVVAQNLPPATRAEVLTYTEVVKVAVTCGWLATLQLKPDSDMTAEMVLKFWEFSSDRNEFSLNTAIDFPHSASVTSMEFTPYDDDGSGLPLSLVTAGLDAKFKVWTMESGENAVVTQNAVGTPPVVKSYWTCERVGFYQNRPATACCFSTDGGSVLAVGFGSTLTLWQFVNNHLLAALPVTTDGSSLKYLGFGNESSAHLLLCATDENVVSFDIISLAVLWRLPLVVSSICRDPLSSHFALFTDKQTLVFLELRSAKTLHKVQLSKSSVADPVISSVFVPSSDRSSQLYFADCHQKLISYGPKQDPADSSVSRKIHKTETPFGTILAMSQIGGTTRGEGTEDPVRLDHKHNLKVLESAAHTLPGLKSLAPTFIHSCLVPKQPNDQMAVEVRSAGTPELDGKKKKPIEGGSTTGKKKKLKTEATASLLEFDFLSEMFSRLAK